MKKRVYLCLFIVLCQLGLWAQPLASFTVDNTSICLGESVQFTNTSSGNGLTYVWDFSDGVTGTETNPIHTYSTAGTYDVCLYVSDDQGAMDTLCQVGLITVLPISENILSVTLCAGESILVNGNVYGEVNPTGTEVLTAYNGCDSIVVIDIPFWPESIFTFSDVLCAGQIIYVNGNGYDETNPSDTIVLVGAAYNGCDSIITVHLTFEPVNMSTISDVLCAGQIIYVNGNGYDEANPTGMEVLTAYNGCDSIITIDLTFIPPGEIAISDYQVTNSSCNGAADGSFCFLDVICGIPPYTITWSGGTINTLNGGCISNLAAGIYTITITDSNASSTMTFIIEEPLPMQISNLTVTDASCNGSADGMVVFDITGGTQPVTATYPDLAAGSYAFTITDANGCNLITPSITISEPAAMVLDAISYNASCNGAADGAINIAVSGGQPPYLYTWSNGATTQDIDGLSVGLYTVTVTDNNGCIANLAIPILEPSPLTFSMTGASIPCSGDSLCIDLSSAVVGGIPPYSYLWSDGSTEAINCLPEGAVSVTVSDANGCAFISGDVIITAPSPMEIIASTSCVTPGLSDGNINLSVSGGASPYDYQWSNGATTQDINGLSVGQYSVTVTDGNGCTVSETFTLGIIQAMSNDTLGCAGAVDVFVIAPTAISYSWEPAALLDNPNAASTLTNFMLTDSTLFTVTVTDAAGCQDVGEVWVNMPDGPGIVLHATNPTCDANADGSIDLEIICPTAAPYTYDWLDLAGTNNPEDRTGLLPGVYVVVVTDNNGTSTTEAVTLSESALIDVIINTGSATVCEGETISACPGLLPAGLTYQWTGPAGFTSNTMCLDIPNASIINEGCYTLVVTDANGCSGEATFCIEVGGSSPVTIDIHPLSIMCAGESVSLEVFPNGAEYTYFWTPADNISNASIYNPVVSPLQNTTYTVELTDLNSGCVAIASVTIEVIQDCVWPGDTDTNKVVNNFDLLNIGLAFDSIGPVRPNANILWDGQEAPDWTQTILNGPNYKHVDCDGNGSIGYNDTMAVVNNWGQVHLFTGEAEQQFQHDYPIADGLIITAPFYVQPDTLVEGANMLLPIILGEEANVAEDIYGIAFSLNYDTAFIVETAVFVGFGNSWLGSINNNMIAIQRNFPGEGRVDVAMTRIDGNNITDYGQLAEFFITVEDDILFGPGGSNGFMLLVDDAVFSISNVLVLNSSGEEIPVIPTETTAPISTSTNNHTLANLIHIYPNPATERIWVGTKNIQLQQIALYDLNSQLLCSSTSNVLDVQGLAAGLYLIKVQTTAGVYVAKVLVN